jgi:hypothetical protein
MIDDSPKKPRYLTKSLFKMARECPTKLAYVGNPEYGNNKEEDPFLKALAEGGFQVGELAKLYFPGGITVNAVGYDEAVSQTNKLLNEEEVILYEAAIRYENLFARVDVLKKTGNKIALYEVKAKSFNPDHDHFFQKKTKDQEKQLLAEWEPYLYDVAFQSYIAQRALQGHTVSSHLCFVDSSVISTVRGLNQNFLLRRDARGQISIETKVKFSAEQLGTRLLHEIPVDEEVRFIRALQTNGKSFEETLEQLSSEYRRDNKIVTRPGKRCKNCEFRFSADPKLPKLKSGFDECWKNLTPPNSSDALVFDLWNGRATEKLIQEKIYLLKNIPRDVISPEPKSEGSGLSSSQRQWLQIEKEARHDSAPYLDLESLRAHFTSWKFPLHFIDFETAQPALPFAPGRKPYEPIAFQFSHHLVHEDGRVEHAGQFINRERGKFPNFEFITALKAELDRDEGTIFRYAAHENTILVKIHDQLTSSDLPPARIEELTGFIKSITKKRDGKTGEILWQGNRNMVDLRELVLNFYYNPATGGSNSLKYVLPATLNVSNFLKEKYGHPSYGTETGIPSKNFVAKQWVHFDSERKVIDPYRSLDPIFNPAEDQQLNRLYPETEIADGGAAMMAYTRMQFTEMTAAETERISQALLRYCELDTLAMVMLYEYWKTEGNF